ncbi:MAG: hypothetical protein LR015_10225 [Verrucomicrobia bacterium]|nr:hypothetical protein [Verrucomicrobiota bacterium]
MMRNTAKVAVLACVCTLVVPELSANQVLLDDDFSSGSRVVQSLPERSAWFGSSTDRLFVNETGLVGQLDGSSRMWLTYFSNNTPVEIGEGGRLVVDLEFSVTGVSETNTNRGMRIGLF